MGSHHRKTEDGGGTSIAVIENGRVRILTMYNKVAEYTYDEDEDGQVSSWVQNFLDDLKNRILILKGDPNFTVKELGRKQLDGKEVVGFFASGHEVDNGPEVDITIWADVNTGLPVQIETNTEIDSRMYKGQVHTTQKT